MRSTVICGTFALVSVAMVVALAQPFSVRAEDSTLCTYWRPNITQWADPIKKYAGDNGLDPNLVAALIDEESKGNPQLVSPAGAVGLLQIMPYETGFTWRPRTWTLLKPEANLEWGTNTLSEVIRQAQGRITLAVLAYNSGWDRIQLHSTHIFAAKVIDHYARCILTNYGIDPRQVSDYSLYVVAHSSAGSDWVDRFKPDGTFEPLSNFDVATLPGNLPHAVAFSLLDENYIAWWVDVWVDANLNQPTHSTAPYVDDSLHSE